MKKKVLVLSFACILLTGVLIFVFTSIGKSNRPMEYRARLRRRDCAIFVLYFLRNMNLRAAPIPTR